MDYSDKLKALREKFGYTQDEFAQAIEVRRPTYLLYEAGKTIPDNDVLDKIERLLNIDFERIVLNKPTEKRMAVLNSKAVKYNAGLKKEKKIKDLDENEHMILDLYRELSDPEREEFMRYVIEKYIEII